MNFLWSLPAALSLLTLAAHFLRAEILLLAALYVGLVGMLAVPRNWARRTVQAFLLLGTLEWVSLLMREVPVKIASGVPYQRYIVIIGSTAAVALLGAVLLQWSPLARRYLAHSTAAPSTEGSLPTDGPGA